MSRIGEEEWIVLNRERERENSEILLFWGASKRFHAKQVLLLKTRELFKT